MMDLEAMQYVEEGGEEDVLEAAMQVIRKDSDLQSSSGSSSSSSEGWYVPESAFIISRPRPAQRSYRYKFATKRFNTLPFAEKCFHFKEYLHPQKQTGPTHTSCNISGTNRTFRRKAEYFMWSEDRQKLFHMYNDQFCPG